MQQLIIVIGNAKLLTKKHKYLRKMDLNTLFKKSVSVEARKCKSFKCANVVITAVNSVN